MSEDSPAIGIDLGTTYCCVAVLTPENYVDIIENEEGDRTTPSYLKFSDNGEIIGKRAKETTFRDPENVIYDSKRLIGRKFSDRYLQENIKKKIWTFNVSSDIDDSPLIEVTKNGKKSTHQPHEISAKLLAYMKGVAETRIGKPVRNAVITVPAHFNYHQRTATKEAGKLAGLNVLKIINEPTAAVLGYVHKNKITNNQNILVFDLGGGTLDVSVVRVEGKSITVRATSGNTHLGGRDFDNNIVNFIVEKIKTKYKRDVRYDKRKMCRIVGQSESIKTRLSFQSTVFFDFPYFLDGEDVEIEITKENFEKINMHLFECCTKMIKNCLDDAKLERSAIDTILLIGGSIRIPKIQEMIAAFFGGEKELTRTINPDEAVAYGAALEAALLKKGDKLEVSYDLIDVTPLSLGMSAQGDEMSFFIHRNTAIPVTKTIPFFTIVDKQTSMRLCIFEGERSLVKYNTEIGECIIDFAPKPPGYLVDISFYINDHGILEVSAKTDTGAYTKLAIKYKKRTAQETTDILNDAIENKDKDETKLKVINRWCNLETYCIMMQAICTYKASDFNDEELNAITSICSKTLIWLKEHKVESGSKEEEDAILDKQKEVEVVCEPITNKYGYELKNMLVTEFYELMIK